MSKIHKSFLCIYVLLCILDEFCKKFYKLRTNFVCLKYFKLNFNLLPLKGKMDIILREQIDELLKQKRELSDKIHDLRCEQLLHPILDMVAPGHPVLIPEFLLTASIKMGYQIVDYDDDINITISASGYAYDKEDYSDVKFSNFYVSKIIFPTDFSNGIGHRCPSIKVKKFSEWKLLGSIPENIKICDMKDDNDLKCENKMEDDNSEDVDSENVESENNESENNNESEDKDESEDNSENNGESEYNDESEDKVKDELEDKDESEDNDEVEDNDESLKDNSEKEDEESSEKEDDESSENEDDEENLEKEELEKTDDSAHKTNENTEKRTIYYQSSDSKIPIYYGALTCVDTDLGKKFYRSQIKPDTDDLDFGDWDDPVGVTGFCTGIAFLIWKI